MNEENFSNLTWELLKYFAFNYDEMLDCSQEVYKSRISICKSCDQFDDIEKVCMACGCKLGSKARAIIESCPLSKWDVDKSDWSERMKKVEEINIQLSLDNNKESE
jgi:hypothetical protein